MRGSETKIGHCQHFDRNFLINATTTATAVKKSRFFW